MMAGGVDLPRVLVIGAGELGSAVCHRLVRSGIRVFLVDLENPRCVRRLVCFATASRARVMQVEGVIARKVLSSEEALRVAEEGDVPLITGDFGKFAADIKPDVMIDARMLKRNDDISADMAPLVIGLGPGFCAGRDVDVVIETNRGHDLGRVIYDGGAEPDTGVPAAVRGIAADRVIRAPTGGIFRSRAEIGESLKKGDVVGVVGDGAPVVVTIDGLLRGLVADGTDVGSGRKIGDIDPRGTDIDPATISDKARAVGGGVLEAIMHWLAGGSDV